MVALMFGAHADGLQKLAGECGHTGGFQDGRGPYALFSKPKGICYHPQGFLAISDSQNACIRSIGLDGAQLPLLTRLWMQRNSSALHGARSMAMHLLAQPGWSCSESQLVRDYVQTQAYKLSVHPTGFPPESGSDVGR